MPIPGSLAVLALLIGSLLVVANWIQSVWPEANELSRKVIHIGCGFLLPLSWLLGLPQWMALTAALVATALVALNHQNRWFSLIENVERHTYGTVFYCLSICCLIIFFWNSKPYAMLAGAFVMALADGSASLVGRYVNSPRWKIKDQTKSLAGTTTMLMATIGVIYCLQQGFQLDISLIKIVAIGGIVTGFEQLSFFGIDNLSVPIATSILVYIMTASN